ncbi:aminopeptidase P family protein [Candidatus Chlorohelix sp.]|uniref:M24 family metallopeptidase n=1 Tax=Candidatus Chlorohelix sp. TaxID=3139201 RepID=UPI00307166D4
MSANIYEERCRQAQAVMASLQIDFLFLGPGADMRYLIGTPGMENERMMLFIVPQSGQPVMIVPTLEKLATSKHATYFELLDWSDGVGPQSSLLEALGGAVKQEIKAAVGSHLWSMFLLELQRILPNSNWTTANEILKKLRISKSAEEIKLLKEAAAIADHTFDEVRQLKFAGRRELEIMSDINNLLLKHGQERMEFCIVGSGPNGAQPHHHTGDRIIQPGDAVVLDFGGMYQGYFSDMTRMVLVEGAEADPLYREVYDVVNKARAAGHAQAKPGVTCESVDEATRKVIADAGYGEFFVHRTGHGIGMEVHEEPYIVNGNQLILEPGMAFSIEPGIYLPGRFGVRIEDIAIITDNGEENINLSTHEIVTVR